MHNLKIKVWRILKKLWENFNKLVYAYTEINFIFLFYFFLPIKFIMEKIVQSDP